MVEREQLIAMVKGMQAGDEAATAQMYETFHEDFYYFILKTVNNDRELAEDLTQDTFVKILETIHELEEPVAFVTWAKQIAYHKCTGYFRKKKELLLDENEDGTSAFDIQVEENAEFIPDEALDNKELKQTIMNMINELPEEQRAALLLRYFNEVSVKEIAQIQDVSEGTVKSRLNYARKSIKQAVETYEKKNGVKLHCVGVLPLLLWLFREYRVANELSMAAGTATQTFVLAEETAAVAGMVASGGAAAGAATTTAATTATAATTTAATTATTTAAAVATKSAVAVGIKAAATALSTKIVAGVVAAAVVVGGTAAGITVAKKNNAPQPAPEAAIVQTIEETESAEEVMAEEAVLEETVAGETTPEETTEVPTKTTEPTEETTEVPTEPDACDHYWDVDNVRDDGLALYRCVECGAVMEAYECPHAKYSEENWTDPNDGTVYTFHTCMTCGYTYSSSGTPGTDDYEVGAGAPDGYYQEQNPTTEPTEPPTEAPTEAPEEPAGCDHQWGVDNVRDDGLALYRCEVCDAVKEEYIEGAGTGNEQPVCNWHNWAVVAEEPGLTIMACTYCGEEQYVYSEEEPAACTHPEYSSSVAYHEDGVGYTTTYTCTSCGHVYQETAFNPG